MRAKDIRLACAGAAIVLAASGVVHGAPVFSDGFEAYAGGTAVLDKNIAGVNAAPNGSGNPWFGPAPPNFRVVGTEGGVVPHSGSQMTRGNVPTQANQVWYNAAYRNNGGAKYAGNLQMDFWFYDPNGRGASSPDYQDFAGLGYYSTNSTVADYSTANLNSDAPTSQRLALGASSDQVGAFNDQVYQVQMTGAAGGYDLGSGWFNTTASRSIGWHQGRIVVGAAGAGGLNAVQFYVDNMVAPAFTGTSGTNLGYNVMELNGDAGPANGYFDDVSLTVVPEPAMVGAIAAAGAMLRRRRATRAIR